MKLFREKRKEFNLENHIIFLDYVNALTDKLFEYYTTKIFLIYYFKI